MNGTYYILCSHDFVHFYKLQSNQFSKLQNILAGLQLGLRHISDHIWCFLLLLSSSFQFYSYFGLMFLSFFDLSNLLKVGNGIHFGVILQFSAFFIFFLCSKWFNAILLPFFKPCFIRRIVLREGSKGG